MLVSEFTLTENSANTTTSQLRTVCHADDSVILGTWLQETDHRTIEDQVRSMFNKISWKPIFGKPNKIENIFLNYLLGNGG